MLAALDVPYLAAHAGRVPDARAVGEPPTRPAAGRGHHDGGDPGARRRDRPDGLRRPLGAGQPATQSARHAVAMLERADDAGRARRQAGRAAPHGAAPSARSRLVLFNFPPNAGNTGTAAYLVGVRIAAQHAAGAWRPPATRSRCPADVDALRDADHRRQRGALRRARQRPCPHPGRRPCAPRALARARSRRNGARRPAGSRATAASIFVLGAQFGNVFVGVQPAFGYEGDPMRLLFEKGFAPTHAFSAFYRWLREDFGAHAVLHFGTHGALEFMPGKQAGLSGRLLAGPADRRPAEPLSLRREQPVRGHASPSAASAATLISYLTPPVAHAGLYRGLLDLKASIERWRGLDAGRRGAERDDLAALIQAQAGGARLATAEPAWDRDADGRDRAARPRPMLELEYTLIPHGLHVVGEAPSPRSASSCCRRSPRPRMALGPSARDRGAGRRADARSAALAGPTAGEPTWRMLRELADTDRLLARTTRSPASCTRSTAASSGRRRAATCCARRRCCRRAATCTASIPSASPAPSRCRTARGRPQRLLDRHVGGRPRAAGDGGDRAVGHRQPEDRGRADRPGAGADGRRAALRRLWPPRRRRADPARRARPAAHRRGGDAVRHLPRPAAAADQAAGRGLLPGRHRADEPVEQNFVRKHALAYPGASTAATSRPRRCGSSAMPTAPTAPTSTT